MTRTKRFHAEFAWLGGETPASDVLIETHDDRIGTVTPDVSDPSGGVRLEGLTVPGLVNAHSHVFQRAIRGHTQSGAADFWAWRESMYGVAATLDPESLHDLAYATFVEMALSGITAVGEFHYLHHDRDGNPYDDPNAMGEAVVRAATDAGIRLTLLDTCYLHGGVAGAPLEGAQRRFSDGSFEAWAERVEALAETDRSPLSKTGTAIHSVRAVPRDAMAPIADFARDEGMVLHAHVSEQPAENDACIDAYGLTPTELLAEEGVLGPTTTVIHATHLTDGDIGRLGGSNTTVCLCPTTERDLADGVGPAVELSEHGSPLCVGSDGHMTIDLFEEARAIELDERLVTGKRGHFRADELFTALTESAANAIGWDAGRIAPGALADFVTVPLDTPRTAGARAGDPLAHAAFAAIGADVSDVVIGGRRVVENGRHVETKRPGDLLDSAIEAALADEN